MIRSPRSALCPQQILVCTTLALTLASALSATQAAAQDIRAIGMGGATVAAGRGMNGALSNPAALMQEQRENQNYHFSFSLYGTFRDSADAVKRVEDNQDLISDIEREIETIGNQTLTCNPITATADTPCLNNTSTLGQLSGDALDLFNALDGKPVDGQIGSNLGLAVTHTRIPFFINLGFRVTGAGVADITEADKTYTETLTDVLSDNVLTWGEIINSAPITLTATQDSVDIAIPDDILQSEGTGGAVYRSQISVGLATEMTLGGYSFDVGVIPKLSTLTASDLTKSVNDLSEDDDLVDELKVNETTESSFTFDLGASTSLPSNDNIILAGVIRNVVPESIKTRNNFEFKTTPQAIVSALYSKNWYSFTADLALNKAKNDNFETQRLSLGTELGQGGLKFRTGIQHDMAVDNDPTEFAIGVGLGFFDFAVSFNDSSIQTGVQIKFGL